MQFYWVEKLITDQPNSQLYSVPETWDKDGFGADGSWYVRIVSLRASTLTLSIGTDHGDVQQATGGKKSAWSRQIPC